MHKFIASLCFVLVISISGCPAGTENGTQEPDTSDPILARIVIPLPTVPDSRAVGLENAKTYTNYFEAYFCRTDVNPNWKHSAGATIAEEKIEVSVPAGTYNIILMAGNKWSGNSYPLVLASSYALNKNIILGSVNQIDMELATFDVNIIAPEYVEITTTFTVSVEVSPKNPLIVDLAVDLKYGVNNASYEFRSYNWVIQNNVFKGSHQLTAPLNPVESSIWIDNSYINPFDGGFGSTSTWRIGLNNWPNLGSYFSRTINFFDGQVMPEVEINITWPD